MDRFSLGYQTWKKANGMLCEKAMMTTHARNTFYILKLLFFTIFTCYEGIR